MEFDFTKKLRDFTLDFNYSFEKGVLIIEGESGAGKTTVLNCISGIDTPDEGLIIINGTIMLDTKNGTDIEPGRRKIGYVFQDYALFPHMDIMKNVQYGLKSRRMDIPVTEVEKAMETFGIASLKHALPDSISGGEKQRVAILRAILTKPDLLLLDEPFSALDHGTKNNVYDEFDKISKLYNIPTILITHNPYEAERFGDHIVRIEQGKISIVK
ncbi:MAG: ATP-binding cassette domain-containing protein [Clostridiaceae bacterium]